jgi:peptide/nickel transport system substrate-binding protein
MRTAIALAAAAVVAVSLSACGAGKSNNNSNAGNSSGSSGGGKSITIGTTDKVIALDPAGSYDNGSLLLEDNIYQFLLRVPAGEKQPQPDAADKCEFTAPTEYTCTLKDNQKFSNGDVMTADDVVF